MSISRNSVQAIKIPAPPGFDGASPQASEILTTARETSGDVDDIQNNSSRSDRSGEEVRSGTSTPTVMRSPQSGSEIQIGGSAGSNRDDESTRLGPGSRRI